MIESRSKICSEDRNLILSSVSSFIVSVDQSTKYGIGLPNLFLSWVPNGVVIQTQAAGIIFTVVADEGANIGLIEEYLLSLKGILLPFCVSLIDEH